MSVFVRNSGTDLQKVAILKVNSEDIDELAANKVTYNDTQTQLGANNVQSAIQKLKSNFQGGVDAIYNACVAKGSTPASHSLSDVVAGINAIPTGTTPTGTLNISNNGNFDVSNYATAAVAVPASAVVSGTALITSNGTVDVTTYKNASVNVPASAVTSGTYTYTGQESSWTQDVTINRYADATNVYNKGVSDGSSQGQSQVLESNAAFVHIPAGSNTTSSVNIFNASYTKNIKVVACYDPQGNNPLFTLDGVEVETKWAKFNAYKECIIPPRTNDTIHKVSFTQSNSGGSSESSGYVDCVVYGVITTVSDERTTPSSGDVNIA